MNDDIEWLKAAYACALNSRDRSTQNGAVLVTENGGWLGGFNDILPGVVDTEERRVAPLKYAYTEHAERAVIYKCAVHGLSTLGGTLYCPWFACSACSNGIVAARITRVVGHKQMFDQTPDRWKESVEIGWTIMQEAGVEIELVDQVLNVAPILYNGKLWTP